MKNLYKIGWGIITALLLMTCDYGIDPITEVTPNADQTAPQITINSPVEGAEIKVFEKETTLIIDLKVTDDVEVKEVRVNLDDNQIASFDSFKDYRIVLKEFIYENLKNGNHILKVTATDLEGKTSTREVNFQKSPPYLALFDREVLYMPFDVDYLDLLSFIQAEKIGSPGFAGGGFLGANAYKGATDSYLNFPLEGLNTPEFSAAFWYKVEPNPDRAGILVVGDNTDDRFQGFRLFREGNTDQQRIKLNVGTGTGESWNDGGIIHVSDDKWVHITISISETKSTIYFDGIEILSANLSAPIDWTNCEFLTIGSGGPTFDYWNHKSDNSQIDELRIFDKALDQNDIQIMLNEFNPYTPQYDGESFYMPFDGSFIDLVGSKAASPVGTPNYNTEGQQGQSYLGAMNSYLNYPAEDLLSSEFSGSFWYKVNAEPDRAGIIVIGDDEENRFQGFRLFREGNAEEQRIKLNVGTGAGESWNDGDVIDATQEGWVHIAFTIAKNRNTIYFNGSEVRSSDMSSPIDWTGCDIITIGSGGSTFSYWDHLSDHSSIDELRFFNKALSAEEVAMVAGGTFIPKNHESTLYMSFDKSYLEANSNKEPTVVGTPKFAGESRGGSDSYAGEEDSYLTFPIDNLFTSQFSGLFWYKVSSNPDRAGILTVSPPMNGSNNDLSTGFRLFREGDAEKQRIKLHVGTDGGDVWNDGHVIDVTKEEWLHVAFTVSDTSTQIYFNGEPVDNSGDMAGQLISWENCSILSIASGAPNFIGWNHLSDLSFIDELYLFDRVLSQEEIQEIMNSH
ncbi:MAG: LamG domain-containing protein [Flavobacteriaceae bacterium]|nr:LamG domain-containing protein [Flavobacteriaceae bacterium]